MTQYQTVDYNVVTGETTIIPWTQEQIDAFLIQKNERDWELLRQKRNILLSESDIMVLPDRWENYTAEKKTEWTNYRQALRDLPENTTDPENPVWPVKPE